MNAAKLRSKALRLRVRGGRAWSERKARRLNIKAHNLERAARLADQAAREARIEAFDAELAGRRMERERRSAYDARLGAEAGA